MRQSYAYGESNSHIHADSDSDGNGAVANGDSYCNGYCHIHSDCDCDGNCHIHSDCDSDIYCNGNCDRYSYGDAHSHRTASAYTDATPSADTAGPSEHLLLRQF